MYLPANNQLKNRIKHSLFNFKIKIDSILSSESWLFCIFFHFSNSLPLNLINLAI